VTFFRLNDRILKVIPSHTSCLDCTIKNWLKQLIRLMTVTIADELGVVDAVEETDELDWKMLTKRTTDNEWNRADFWQQHTFDQSG